MNIVIQKRWDGHLIPEQEWVRLSLKRHRSGLQILVDAPFYGDPKPVLEPGPTPGLWEYEVVELFVLHDGAADSPRYTEVELGPHGHHLVLCLDGVRQVVSQLHPLQYSVQSAAGETRRWRGVALVPHALLPPPPWRCNATAIHGVDSARAFLSWTPLPGDGPDFHRLAGWPLLELS